MLLLTTLALAGSTEWTPEAGVVQRGATTATTAPRAAAPATVDVSLLGAILKNQSPSPMVVNVWASWCGPCVAELPVFEALSKSGGANVILVNVDHPNAVLYADRVAASRAPTTRQLHLAPDDVAVAFAPWQGVIPVTLVIAPGGGVKARFVGGVDSDTLARALAAP